MRKFLKKFRASEHGSFAVYFALSLSLLMGVVGVALESSRMSSMDSKAQDAADRAALTAAIYMTKSELTDLSVKERKQEARKIAKEAIDNFITSSSALKVKPTFSIDDEAVTVDLAVTLEPIMMNMFGIKTLSLKTKAVAHIGTSVAHNVDIALISDATGSMQTTLDAIQDNMKDFSKDLAKELLARDVKSGNIRVKFIFYRDFMIDNHKDWTGPDMKPKSGMEGMGALYGSKFFTLPDDKSDMDSYVDFFVADGGGSFRESGLEAISYALNDENWGNGADTVRAIILWTDASTRSPSDTEEIGLTPMGPYGYWNDSRWKEVIGRSFPYLSKEAREKYMFDKFAEKYTVKSLPALAANFNAFHQENAGNLEGVKTMSINVFNGCSGLSPCGDWDAIASWDGVSYFPEKGLYTSSETYEQIIKQIADTVENQLVAKDIAIKQ